MSQMTVTLEDARTRVLLEEQNVTLATPRRRAGLVARSLFFAMDALYGRRRTLQKFLVLELVARVPYQTWEHAAYLSITRHARDTVRSHEIYRRVVQSREQQDNEQWHLFIIEDMLEHRGVTLGRFRYRLLPQIIAFVYYQVSWLMFVIRPEWSYRLNADFEDHAEHEYMAYVAEHPELAGEACSCSVADDYGCPESFGDVLRQIALDERHHRDESLDDLRRLEADRAARRTEARRSLH
jgi:ubiquinol oxidase